MIALVGVAGLSWWLAPEPASPGKIEGRTADWKLPVLALQQTDNNLLKINAANLWGAPVQAVPQATANEPEWRFVGVTVSGSENVVLISVDSKPPQLLKAGDMLPGGAKIISVTDDHLCLLIKGKKRRLDIF